MNRSVLRLFLLVTASLLAGCITHEETVYRGEPRAAVEFENDAAARIFYQALSETPPRGSRSESQTTVKLPLLFKHKRSVISGDDAVFNDAVRLCDTDQDRRITEAEARRFADRQQKG